jgi:hypothetical protein
MLKAKSRFLRGEKWSRPDAVGTVGQSTCMPHVVHDAMKACWLLACPRGLSDAIQDNTERFKARRSDVTRYDTRRYGTTNDIKR